MKKIIILMTLLLVSPIFAQINNTNTMKSIDITADPSTISIAPGVSILPPWWAKNLGENSPNQAKNSDNSTQNQNPSKILEPNTQNEVLKKADEQKNVSIPVQTTQTLQNINIKSSSEKEIKKPTLIITDISSWNKTTQKEIEGKAKVDLEEKYLKFLTQ